MNSYLIHTCHFTLTFSIQEKFNIIANFTSEEFKNYHSNRGVINRKKLEGEPNKDIGFCPNLKLLLDKILEISILNKEDYYEIPQEDNINSSDSSIKIVNNVKSYEVINSKNALNKIMEFFQK